jgi:hypothetical protein
LNNFCRLQKDSSALQKSDQCSSKFTVVFNATAFPRVIPAPEEKGKCIPPNTRLVEIEIVKVTKKLLIKIK